MSKAQDLEQSKKTATNAPRRFDPFFLAFCCFLVLVDGASIARLLRSGVAVCFVSNLRIMLDAHSIRVGRRQ
ncbi:hypothetical protein [Caballeronia sp. GAFFF1]|uniref:hypothetical protein n=1 Tax=Caballeronia sp. GAFFF1 TaxID=2921779 RepID=UPI002027EFA1|nr:hypothetical protein [Caballeronia sp. GAFFF1]